MYKNKIKAEFIVKRHKRVVNYLNNIEGQMAVFMVFSQIGKTLQKIDDKILEKYYLLENRKRGLLHKKLYSPRL